MAAIWNPSNRIHVDSIARILPALSERLQLAFQPLAVQTLEELEGAFQAAVRYRADALYVLGDPLYNANPARFADLAAKYRLPAIYLFTQYVEAGGLISYDPDPRDLLPRAASLSIEINYESGVEGHSQESAKALGPEDLAGPAAGDQVIE
jgi:putative ABC transport system substrate-binding protein